MKNRMRSGLILAGVGLSFLFYPVFSGGYSTNPNHKLGVYCIFTYGTYSGVKWKDDIGLYYEMDPAGRFWDIMTGGADWAYANGDSMRRINDQVNYETVFPIPGGSERNWNQFDLVFFYGHNNMITPPHECDYEEAFWSNAGGAWNKIYGNWCDWGTNILPYEYYSQNLTDGKYKPGAVVYFYEPFTSALLGYQFQKDYSWPVQKTAKDTPSGNSPATLVTCSGGLGNQGLKWLILYGCQAVIVANKDGSLYNPMGLAAFRPTWDGFHIILGHYLSYPTYRLIELDAFAYNLLSGMPVQEAYFLTDPSTNSSAISAEIWGVSNYMDTETWKEPQANLGSPPNTWKVKWIQRVGTTASYWETVSHSNDGKGCK